MSLFKKDKVQKSVREFDDNLPDVGNIDFGSNTDYKNSDKTDPTANDIVIDSHKAVKRKNLSYGIEEAIVLMRDLPTEPIELVVKVVKTTLESIDVQVSDIIDDAKAKEKNIENRITQLSSEIKNYEDKIKNLKDSISLLETDQAETKRVKEHLMLAKGSSTESNSNKKHNKSGGKGHQQDSKNNSPIKNQSSSNEGSIKTETDAIHKAG